MKLKNNFSENNQEIAFRTICIRLIFIRLNKMKTIIILAKEVKHELSEKMS